KSFHSALTPRCRDSCPHSSLLRCRCLLRPFFAFHLRGRDEYFRGHPRDEGAFGIVQAYLEHNGPNVALAAAHVSLGSEIAFHSLKEKFAPGDGPTGQPDTEHVAIANVVGIGLGNGSANPGVVQINNRHDRRSDGDYLSLSGR